jgi:hypothetical protein
MDFSTRMGNLQSHDRTGEINSSEFDFRMVVIGVTIGVVALTVGTSVLLIRRSRARHEWPSECLRNIA